MAATGKVVPVIAKENGHTKMMMYRVIKCESTNVDVRELISSIIKKSVNEIWPEPAEEEKE